MENKPSSEPANNATPETPSAEPLAQEQPPAVVAPPSLASILVPCCGQLEYTRLCLPSLVRHTRYRYELIFLDIGSLDGTAEYLAGFSVSAPVRVAVVRAPTDSAIGRAVQDALQQARGDYLVLLNNDTIVGDAWLNQLISLARFRQ